MDKEKKKDVYADVINRLQGFKDAMNNINEHLDRMEDLLMEDEDDEDDEECEGCEFCEDDEEYTEIKSRIKPSEFYVDINNLSPDYVMSKVSFN